MDSEPVCPGDLVLHGQVPVRAVVVTVGRDGAVAGAALSHLRHRALGQDGVGRRDAIGARVEARYTPRLEKIMHALDRDGYHCQAAFRRSDGT